MIRINQMKLPVSAEPAAVLKERAAKLLHLREGELRELHIARRSIDARKKPEILFSYTVYVETGLSGKAEQALVRHLRNRDISFEEPVIYKEPRLHGNPEGMMRPAVVGFGPAGMFSALLLARAGLCPLVIERGAPVEERVRDVEALWKDGTLRPDSNPQFGEGGAGTFSDGKLNTLVKDREGRGRYVLETFVHFGADPEILMDAKPHVGTDRLLGIVRGIREEIRSLGGEIRFHTTFIPTLQLPDLPEPGKLTDDLQSRDAGAERQSTWTPEPGQPVILATGHSARDTCAALYAAGLRMEAKDFAMGLRVQHPQEMIDAALYGTTARDAGQDHAAAPVPYPGPAAYKLAYTSRNGRGLYSFCMCPGGYVVNASSEPGRLSVNGMSYHSRDGVNANAAIIMSIRKEDYGGEKDPLAGIALQRELEARAYQLGRGRIPMERYGAFRKTVEAAAQDKPLPASAAAAGSSTEAAPALPSPAPDPSRKTTEPAFRGQYSDADLTELFAFPENSPYRSLNCFNETLIEGMEQFDRQIPGFARADAILAGVEARTSSAVRILRNADFQAMYREDCEDGKARPLYFPCGEGAGYAGGIMSAAMDGLKTAEAVISILSSP